MSQMLMETRLPGRSPNLYGLVLAGGRSTRMRSDKAAIRYHDRDQAHHVAALLTRVCERVYVSIRPDQTEQPTYRDLPIIVDEITDAGPIAGLYSAFKMHAHCAWLVVPIDLANLTTEHLEYLFARRDRTCAVSATRCLGSSHVDPLFAVYEPAAQSIIERAVARGDRSLRMIVEKHGSVVELPWRLRNVNDPTARAEFMKENRRR
ncbi:MAG: hypothetical protein EA426_15150 [Spirochaetaceae bacterium]|nr:MAG: hypothetical protein EA426_15150 [Spirochaetaceae bacterium]